GNLGLFMIASSLASILSSYVWGRLSDQSSRKTLAAAGLLSSACFAAAALLGIVSGGLGTLGLAAVFIFVAQVAYQGARQGRKTHLTDMDTPDGKATYTALSNSLIGVLLLLGGGFGILADYIGAAWILAIFAVMSLAALPVALGLNEVQHPDDADS
ncbi:MAG: MFS transporter, partial [Mangrovicoccus sp.]